MNPGRKSSPIPSLPQSSVLRMPEKRSSLPGMRRRFGRLHKRQSSPVTAHSGDPLRQTSMATFVTHSDSKQPARPAPQSGPTPTDSSQILKGVVACLDIRTEDGDDVSQNFERELQSMGAKTRKTFSDSITHLIFKNGSSTTLRKALSKHVSIVNLLWIRRCKREGKRLPEKDFLIDRPQTIALTGSKRRKSMEPGKVRGLMKDNTPIEKFPSGSFKKRPISTAMLQDTKEKRQKSRAELDGSGLSSGNSLDSFTPNPEQASTSQQRPHDQWMSLKGSSWETEDMTDTHSIEDDGTTPPDEEIADPIDTSSAPVSSEDITELNESVTSSMSAPRPQVRKEVKDEFYFGDVDSTEKLSRMSMSILAPLRRKRRSLGTRLSLGNAKSLDQSSSLSPKPISLSSTTAATPPRTPLTGSAIVNLPKPSSAMKSRPLLQPTLSDNSTNLSSTIVMTSIDEARRKRYANVIEQLGTYKIARSVDDRTSCVIVGESRRTETVLLGMLSGLWIITPQWIEDSEKAGKYLPKEDYEASAFFPRVSAARKHKRGTDPITHKRMPGLIPSSTRIFVNSSRYRPGLAKELVEKAGGSVVQTENEADVIISKQGIQSDKIVVNDNWILDSIEKWRYLSTDKYSK